MQGKKNQITSEVLLPEKMVDRGYYLYSW